MAEYIERDELIADIEKRYCRPCEAAGKDYNHVLCRACWVDDMMGEIGDAPFYDVAPVVRCKDCKHFLEKGGILEPWCDWHEASLFCGDGFCAAGERKDGDE